METKWLLDFISLANTGSFSKAAQERYVTQSAFSRRIRCLENWLGTDLFDRTKHPVSLTDPGIRFVETAEQLVRLTYKVREDFGFQIAGRPKITFATATNLAITFMPKWLRDNEIGDSNVDIVLRTDYSGMHAYFESLSTPSCDFIVHYGRSFDSLAMDGSKFEDLTIGKDVLMPVCHRNLWEQRDMSLPGSSESPLPYISPIQNSMIAKAISDCLVNGAASVSLECHFESSSLQCTHGLVMQQFGFAWLPESAIGSELQAGTLVPVGGVEYNVPISIVLFRYLSNKRPETLQIWDAVGKRYGR